MGKNNQKTVKVIKQPCDKNNYYSAINLQALEKALNTLDGDAFKMWVYFSKNTKEFVSKHQIQLSSSHAKEVLSLSKDAYNKAIHTLIDKGYLVDSNIDPEEKINRWTFYELPLSGDTDKPLQKNDISLEAQENKACITEQTTKNKENINIINQTNPIAPKDFMEMTDQQRRQFFNQYF